MGKFKIISEKKLVIIYISGKYTADMGIELVNAMVDHPDYDPRFDSVTDLRDSIIPSSNKELRKMLDHMIRREGFNAKRKVVYISTDASQVLVPMAMNMGTHNFPMNISVHSSVGLALSWLDHPNFSEEEYSSVVEELKASA